MRDCPTIATRGRDVKQAPYNGLIVRKQKKNHLYDLKANHEENLDEGDSKL